MFWIYQKPLLVRWFPIHWCLRMGSPNHRDSTDQAATQRASTPFCRAWKWTASSDCAACWISARPQRCENPDFSRSVEFEDFPTMFDFPPVRSIFRQNPRGLCEWTRNFWYTTSTLDEQIRGRFAISSVLIDSSISPLRSNCKINRPVFFTIDTAHVCMLAPAHRPKRCHTHDNIKQYVCKQTCTAKKQQGSIHHLWSFFNFT